MSPAVPEGVTLQYRIWRGISPSNMPAVATVYSPATTFSDPNGGTGGLVSGTTYYYRVVAFNADGASGGTVNYAASAIAP